MSRRAECEFDVTGWDAEDGGSPAGADAEGGPVLGQAVVRKRYRGRLEGEGTARLLTCRADLAKPMSDAGYLAAEQVSGTLDGKTGTFVMHHWGVAAAGSPPRTGGHVVPGSATGQLTGLSGTVEIAVDATGKHTLTLDYELP